MGNGGIVTLKILPTVKARRERRIREALATLSRREATLSEEQATLLDERQQIRDVWRRCGSNGQVRNRASLQDLKIELAACFQRDLTVTAQIDTLQRSREELAIEKANQESLLRKVLVEQEKLNTLME
jgi:hypothetical protein